MDQETREFLEQKFGTIDQRFDRIDQRFGTIDQQLETIDQRLDGMDQRFDGMDQRFDGMDQRFDRVEEEARHTRILVEGLKSDLQAVAEGFTTVDAKVARSESTVRAELEEERQRSTQLHGRLEGRITDLERRVVLLEGSGG